MCEDILSCEKQTQTVDGNFHGLGLITVMGFSCATAEAQIQSVITKNTSVHTGATQLNC